ncbi:MAG: hypothetical protein AAF413_03640 [Patescibacteria group bacterium]
MAESKKGVILIDMDGTGYDFDGAIARKLGQDYGIGIDHRSAETFYLRDSFPGYAAQIAEIHNGPDFFYELDPYPGFVSAVRKVQAAGYVVRFCSSPLPSNPSCEQQKRSALERDFGAEMAENAIIDRNKSVHDGLLLVDDKPEIPDAESASWTQIYYARPCNYYKIKAGGLAIEDWSDVSVEQLLHMADKRLEELAA